MCLPALTRPQPRRVGSTIVALVVALTLAAGAPTQIAAAPADPSSEAARLVFLLQYIATDYDLAVRDGKVVNEFEYDEIGGFTRLLLRSARKLSASRATRKGLRELQARIRALRPSPDVVATTKELVQGVIRERGLRPFPLGQPDLARGRELYASDCAACHGSGGAGDGPASSWQDPRPSAFTDARMNRVSPHQIHGAVAFGIDGTAMPSYADVRSPEDIWAVAFHVMTLREGFTPQQPASPVAIDLVGLARHANEDLLAQLAPAHPELTLGAIDYYRLHPPAPDVHGMAADLDRATASPAPAAAVATDVGTAGAVLSLESAFQQIAERGFASTVGITTYRRTDSKAAAPEKGAATGWRVAGHDHERNAGYQPIARGSGFFISKDGYLLTCRHLLIDPKTGEPAEVIEVEVHEERFERARVVALEPTINLAVLKVELQFDAQPVSLGNAASIRSGHWVIAVGNPSGPEQTFTVGTASARPERECYQEQRTATLLQASLRIPPSSYGGPLLNSRGEVIAMSTPRDAAVGPEPDAMFGQTYGLPIDLAMNLFEPLRAKESQRSPWIGISVLSLSGEVRRRLTTVPKSGVYIDDVFDPSPAASAGLKVGDVLVQMGDQPMFSVYDFQRSLYLANVGKEVTLLIDREGKTFTRKVVIEQRPPNATTR
jgi:serine protease Do